MGRHNMTARARELSGECTINSAPDWGTRVQCTVPIASPTLLRRVGGALLWAASSNFGKGPTAQLAK